MQRWRRLGLVFRPNAQHAWMHSHAANPTAEMLGPNHVRVHFSCRDSAQRSSIAWVDLELAPSPRVIGQAQVPELGPGQIGLFDDSGVSIGSLVRTASADRLYYMGWNLAVTVPWRNSIGLALGRSGESFRQCSPVPVLDRNRHDPFTLSYPWVVERDGRWHMWYGSNLAWGASEQDMHHVVKYAESSDGLAWHTSEQVCIGLQGDEIGIARPCVLWDKGIWRMWYGYRGEQYRIGYAESDDGRHWQRLDHLVGWLGEPGEWESAAQTYPCVIRIGESLYMFYNGNHYGRTGFGLACLEDA